MISTYTFISFSFIFEEKGCTIDVLFEGENNDRSLISEFTAIPA